MTFEQSSEGGGWLASDETDLPDVMNWLDEVKREEVAGLDTAVSLEILLPKICRYMVETAQLQPDPRYGQFGS